jgi:hypothetical protein
VWGFLLSSLNEAKWHLGLSALHPDLILLYRD